MASDNMGGPDGRGASGRLWGERRNRGCALGWGGWRC